MSPTDLARTPSLRVIRVGVIGVGEFGSNHAQIWRDLGRIVQSELVV